MTLEFCMFDIYPVNFVCAHLNVRSLWPHHTWVLHALSNILYVEGVFGGHSHYICSLAQMTLPLLPLLKDWVEGHAFKAI